MAKSRDNLQGVERGCLGKLFLWPGMLVQWFMYMFPSKGKARNNARLARSSIITWLISLCFWGFILILLWRPIYCISLGNC